MSKGSKSEAQRVELARVLRLSEGTPWAALVSHVDGLIGAHRQRHPSRCLEGSVEACAEMEELKKAGKSYDVWVQYHGSETVMALSPVHAVEGVAYRSIAADPSEGVRLCCVRLTGGSTHYQCLAQWAGKGVCLMPQMGEPSGWLTDGTGE